MFYELVFCQLGDWCYVSEVIAVMSVGTLVSCQSGDWCSLGGDIGVLLVGKLVFCG